MFVLLFPGDGCGIDQGLYWATTYIEQRDSQPQNLNKTSVKCCISKIAFLE